MPSHISSGLCSRIAKHKAKMIAKPSKLLRTRTSELSFDSQEFEQNTMTGSFMESENHETNPISPFELSQLVKQIHHRLRYGQDTLFVCLTLLSKLKIQIDQSKAKRYAAALIHLGGKVHQYRTPRFSDLAVWSDFTFSRQELITTESQLLFHFQFKIPIHMNFQNIKEVQKAIGQLESKLLLASTPINFQ